MKNSTRIVVLVDRSGSMQKVQQATVSGINEFITAQKSDPGEATIRIIQFDEDRGKYMYETILDGPLKNINSLKDDQYTPRGMTPLNDAIGQTIDDLGNELRSLPEAERPEKVLVCIVTDGYENASTKFKKARVKEMVEHQQAKYNWKFTFIGANIDAISEAAGYGIASMDALQFTQDVEHTKVAFAGLSDYTTAVRSVNPAMMKSVGYSSKSRKSAVSETDTHANNANISTPEV